MTKETLPLEIIVHDLRELHAKTTQGEWRKGKSTHETMAYPVGAMPYHVADFRHANDASFCDAAHDYMPRILDALVAQHARITELEACHGCAVQQGYRPSEALQGIAEPAVLTDEQIDAAFERMPGGAQGFLKSWGYRQFAREIAELTADNASLRGINDGQDEALSMLEADLNAKQQMLNAALTELAAQAQRAPLTDELLAQLFEANYSHDQPQGAYFKEIARIVERAHGIGITQEQQG